MKKVTFSVSGRLPDLPGRGAGQTGVEGTRGSEDGDTTRNLYGPYVSRVVEIQPSGRRVARKGICIGDGENEREEKSQNESETDGPFRLGLTVGGRGGER